MLKLILSYSDQENAILAQKQANVPKGRKEFGKMSFVCKRS